MALQESGEMYLESILVLREKQANVRSIDIVNQTGYSKPSISRAVGLLRRDGLIEVDSEGYITLTPIGESHAKKIYEISKGIQESDVIGSLSYLNTKEKELLVFLLQNREIRIIIT